MLNETITAPAVSMDAANMFMRKLSRTKLNLFITTLGLRTVQLSILIATGMACINYFNSEGSVQWILYSVVALVFSVFLNILRKVFETDVAIYTVAAKAWGYIPKR